MTDTPVVYELPLNELMRLALRLEYVFGQIDICEARDCVVHQPSVIMGFIVDVLNLLDRPDCKPRLTKEFNRFINHFSKLNDSDEVKQEVLQDTLEQLKRLLEYFLGMAGKIAQPLRDNAFLAAVRHNLLVSGGGIVDVPMYRYWLSQPERVRRAHIQEWLSAFKEIRLAIALLLNIVRTSSETEMVKAPKGFYHEALDSKAPSQLLRVGLPENMSLFPEISAGKHRMTVRFMEPNVSTGRSVQTTKNITFTLTKCII